MAAVSLTVLFRSRLFLTRSDLAGLPIYLRVAGATFVVLDSIDMLSATFDVGLLRLRPARWLGPGFLSGVLGLAGVTNVVMREVFAGLMRLDGAGFGCFGTGRTAGGDFAVLIRVAMREVSAVFVRVDELVAGLVFAWRAGGLAGRTDVVMREVFAGLTRVVVVGAGFGGFGVVGAGEGLEILRAGVTLRGGAETFGGLERGAGLLGLGALGLATVGGGLLRLGRAEALGAG